MAHVDKTQFIDLTPQGLLTPDGVKRVNNAEEELYSATVAFANEASEFFKLHRDTLLGMAGNNAALREDIHQMDALISARHRKTDAFLRAVAGQPATEQAGIVHELTQLQHAEADPEGPWALYIFGPDGLHSGRQYFGNPVMYPDEEIAVAEAKVRADIAIAKGHEVRICNLGDLLVFHSKDGQTVHGDGFWEKASRT
jgi:hypothetical protein